MKKKLTTEKNQKKEKLGARFKSFNVDEIFAICKSLCSHCEVRPLSIPYGLTGRVEGEFVVYVRPYDDIDPKIYFTVYTSCDPHTGIARSSGKDALRIAVKGKKIKEKEPKIIRNQKCLEKFEDQLREMIKKHKPRKNVIKDAVKCPKCREGFMIVKNGKFGKFESCSRFPACRHAEDTFGSLQKYLDQRKVDTGE